MNPLLLLPLILGGFDERNSMSSMLGVPHRCKAELRGHDAPHKCHNPECNEMAAPGRTHCSADCFNKHVRHKQ